jgi:putative membrane protein
VTAGGQGPIKEVWDTGLQNERTSLAWTRSTLACLGCGLLLARLAAGMHWIFGTVIAMTVLVLAALAGRATRHRYHHAAHALINGDHLPDGLLPALTATLTLIIAIAAVALAVAGL